ncbi:MAG TPA: DoxX family protein [bacterium]|nr:DoxX family protein [bacterium]
MNTLLWILQAILAVVFLLEGGVKILKPAAFRVQGLGDAGLLIFIGLCEVGGAVGLVLPSVTHFLPWLTPLAALGIAAIMVLATRFHLRRHEPRSAGLTLLLLVLSLTVSYGRWMIPASS